MTIKFRRDAVTHIPRQIGVYALCDLDGVPIYVGQSVDGIQSRTRRHLTSARSDIIANRQVDVWEIAYVWAWPVQDKQHIGPLESLLFHRFDHVSKLMNGTIPIPVDEGAIAEPEKFVVQVMAEEEIEARRQASIRLPRQIEHYQRLVDHMLTVKDTNQLRRSAQAHFERLARYHRHFLGQGNADPSDSDDDGEA